MKFVHVANDERLAAHTIYPPNYCCINSNCTNRAPLKKHYFKKAVIYTDSSGVQPAWNISLYCTGKLIFCINVCPAILICTGCYTSYHHNYLVRDGSRTYYSGIPDVLQVGEHQFVETKLVYTWRSNMLFGWYVF